MAESAERNGKGINSWLQIAANLAILGGVGLVLMQIHQANKLTGVQMLDSNLDSGIARELALMGESPNESLFRVMTDSDDVTA